ncbi:MAG: hypothetical protein JWR85_3810 [Marmoricola sp.]|nr:hypothetical protein [Marmoricola sp.]
MRQQTDTELVADIALRCAWLRHHAYELREVDRTGQLTAALFDFADLLEWRYC